MLLVVTVLLATHGEPATREEKFRGALVSQASPEGGGHATGFASPKIELEALTANRPSFVGATVALGVGGAVSLNGVVFGIVGALMFPGGGPLFALVVGAMIFGLGFLTGVIAGIVMAVIGAEVTRVDARIRKLELQAGSPATTARFDAPPVFVLTRF